MRECVFQHLIDEPLPDVYRLNRHTVSLLDGRYAAVVHYQ
jgi:hypothetical protein